MRDRRSNLAHRPYKKVRRDAKRAVVWGRVGSWVSLESAVGEELERERRRRELGARPAVLCRAELWVAGERPERSRQPAA